MNLTTNGIDLDVLTTDLLGVLIHCLRHHLDDVGIESATEGGVRGKDHKGYPLHGTHLVEYGLGVSFCSEERFEDMLQQGLVR